MEELENGKERIVRVNIEEQMKSAYIDYSMSVIVSRALPDVRDGMKPVHRRILFAMNELGTVSTKPFKKSARIVGEVMGKYHPHGDSSIYNAMVRMAQDWSMRYMLVDGQGNFGSMDGDPPAAMRYTEARMAKIADEMMADIDKDTVDFQLNFDDTLEEPKVLPCRYPNLIVNGSSGIAVGMATNMAPHNLSEVIDGVIAYIENHDITIEELMQYIKAPDFPTGATVYGYEGVKDAYMTGKGRIVMRGEAFIEPDEHGRDKIVVSSIPYEVNKSDLIVKIADMINEKRIEGISDLRDESDKDGLRIVFDLKKDAISNVVLNKLYQLSALQSSFSINNIALVHGKPKLLNLKDLISNFVDHRHEVVIRRTKFELRKAEERAHILQGLLIALDHIDEVIALIRASKDAEEARTGLMEKFNLSDIQARAIVEMRLRQLTGLERQKIQDEYDELMRFIEYCKNVLENESMRMEIIKNESLEIKAKFGDERKSRIEYASSDFKIEDTIADEEVVVTISHMGYIKRTALTEYKVQNRGGKGSKGSEVRDEDFVEHLFTATMHNFMLFFTEKGKCFWMRVYEIPEGTRQSKGRAIQNLINIEPGDKVKAYINVLNLKDQSYIENNYIILCTQKGVIKKTSLEAYSKPRQNGIIALTVRENDQLLEAKLTNGNNEVMMGLRSGKIVRFNESNVRPMGRSASGVRGITLQNEKDEVIGMVCIENKDCHILVVSENGYGKRSELEDYRETNRGGKGVKTLNITDKTGNLISINNVVDTDDLMIVNKSGIIIRLAVKNLRIVGRATQGVRLIDLRGNDAIASVTKVAKSEDEDDIDDLELTQDGNAENGENDTLEGTQIADSTQEDQPINEITTSNTEE